MSRLSALDASFLSVESATAHMHVGFVAGFEAPEGTELPDFARFYEHIESRIPGAPRFRQKIAPVPLGLHAPEWIDDPAFRLDRHLYWASGPLQSLIDEVMSTPLRRDRPLWEMWFCEEPQLRRMTVVGKAHHCMVDGLAALELCSALLDLTPETAQREDPGWAALPQPGSERLLARGLRDRLDEQLKLLRLPLRAAASPTQAARQGLEGALQVARVLGRVLQGAPQSKLNRPLSELRHLAMIERPFADLQQIRRAFGTTVNDVMLAAVAGGIRDYLVSHGEQPQPLKAMVPVSMRAAPGQLGNQLSFVFPSLPCDESRPLGRLYRTHAQMGESKRAGDEQGGDLALKVAAHAPNYVQQAIAQLLASPRTFNLVVSNIPGPPMPLYLLGCPMRSLHPVVPLAEGHVVSVGMLTVAGNACFGLYADREQMPDADCLARAIDNALDELLSAASERVQARHGEAELLPTWG